MVQLMCSAYRMFDMFLLVHLSGIRIAYSCAVSTLRKVYTDLHGPKWQASKAIYGSSTNPSTPSAGVAPERA